jgi:hypothetical protein
MGPITEEELETELLKIKNRKSPGIAGIQIEFLKYCGNQLRERIFNY